MSFDELRESGYNPGSVIIFVVSWTTFAYVVFAAVLYSFSTAIAMMRMPIDFVNYFWNRGDEVVATVFGEPPAGVVEVPDDDDNSFADADATAIKKDK